MKQILLSLSVLSMLGFAACKKKDNGPSNTATVMFINGCAGAANVNVTANNTTVSAANNMAFLRSSGYQVVTAGTAANIAFTLTSTGTPLANSNSGLTAGSHYSAFLGGLITGPALVVVPDDVASPASGMAKVRFINLSSDNLNLNCYIGANTIDSNVGYKTCTPFSEITPVTGGNILLQDPSRPTQIAQLNGQTFSSGRIYTVMLTGTFTGTGASALTVTVLNNN